MEENQPVQAPAEVVESGSCKLNYYWDQLKRFLRECRRVLKVTQKPNKEEFLTTVKVSALGLTIIGMIGFVLSIIKQLLL